MFFQYDLFFVAEYQINNRYESFLIDLFGAPFG